MTVKAIFFDLDDTLHDHLQPFSNAFKTVFPAVTQVPMLSLYKKFRDYSDLLWKDYSQNTLSLEQLREQRITLALKDFKIWISNDSAIEFQLQYEYRLNHLQLFEEVPTVFKALLEKNYKIGIITNGPVEHQYNKINSLGLTDYILMENVFVSDDVGIAKPDPKIFNYVAKRFDYLPDEFLYVGDSWHNDVAAPIDAGWRAIWFNHRKRQPATSHQPAAIIDSLSEIHSVLDKINQ